MRALLETRQLSVGYRGAPVLSDISLTLPPGKVLCLLGPNGTGKTTLFRSLLGLIPSLSGEILLHGRPLSALHRSEVARYLAHVPQSLNTPFAFQALDLVLMGASAQLGILAQPGKAERSRAVSAMEELGIADLARASVAELSGGQRQMVLLARALAQGATTIIMDEPTASLDFANRSRVLLAIGELRARGTSLLISTHDPDQAAMIGDFALLVGKQGAIANGPVAEVLTQDNLSETYGTPVKKYTLSDAKCHFRTEVVAGTRTEG